MAFQYTTGNPDNLVGGSDAAMIDIQGPFNDIRDYLNRPGQAVLTANGNGGGDDLAARLDALERRVAELEAGQ